MDENIQATQAVTVETTLEAIVTDIKLHYDMFWLDEAVRRDWRR